MSPEERQAVIDEEHLRLLSLFHYVSGGITVAFSVFFGAWLSIMATVISFVEPIPDAPALPAFMFGGLALVFVLGTAYGVVEIVAGRFLARRRHRLFALIAALPRLLFIPYGLILSILTLLVLERPSVKRSFDSAV